VEWHNTGLQDLLPVIMGVNTAVKAAQEQARRRKLLGQSLASEVRLHCIPSAGVSTVPLETWKEVLVVSKVEVLDEYSLDAVHEEVEAGEWVHTKDIVNADDKKIGLAVVTGPTMEKCARCWKYVAEPAVESELPLCTRCSTAVEEVR
jgi:isoleucyl-tRNA synthetase